MKRKIALSEYLSVGFVWFSAALTIAFLFFILGYIMVNGFFFNNRHEYKVSSEDLESYEGVLLVVGKKVHIKELPFDLMVNLFADEYTTWKKLDEQDLDLYPFISDEILPHAAEFLALEETGVLIEYPGDTLATVRAAAAHPGSAALVDAAAFNELSSDVKSSVKKVRVRPYAFGVNQSVTALKDNLRVNVADETDMVKIFKGEITDWAHFDGSPSPIIVVLPPENTPLFELTKKSGWSNDSKAKLVRTNTLDEFYTVLSTTPGAAGLVSYNKIAENKLSFIKLARQESGRNLDLAFILTPPSDSGKIGGISTIILNTFAMVVLTLLFALPPGLFAAIYLVEYAKEGRLVRWIRLGTETLAGIPSIIFGLFGMLVFVQGFGWGISLLSGSFTITLMILPTLVRTAEEALKSVPRALQEGSLALGATKVQTIFRVVLPAAFPAIASGVILAVGRAMGETAALIYTMGSNYNLTSGLFDSTRTLAVHIYLIIAEGISSDRAFASGTVLIFFILIINTSARYLITRMGRMAKA